MDSSRKVLFPKSPVLKLEKILEDIELPSRGVFKLRIEYGEQLEGSELVPYTVRPVNCIRIVDADDLRYGKKFSHRADIRRHLERKGNCDDILLVQRGHVTDTSYANVALFDGSNWYTPAWPLLRGTRREKLIENGTLKASVIRERDLHNFQTLRLVNAMLPWGTGPELAMDKVYR